METPVAAMEPDRRAVMAAPPAVRTWGSEMGGAVAASLALHAGLIGLGWLLVQADPEPASPAELAISVELVAMDDLVSETGDRASEESISLVSAGVSQAASEPEQPMEAVPVEPDNVAEAAAVPVMAALAAPEPVVAAQPVEAVAEVSAEVLTVIAEVSDVVAASIPAVAPAVAPTVAPSDAPILERLDQAAKLAALKPREEIQQVVSAALAPSARVEPVKVGSLAPTAEEVVEDVVEAPPTPAPRITRKPVEAEAEPAETKAAEKPVEKKQPKEVASLGNGGENDADSAAAKASGGSAGKVVSAGAGALDAYQGKVRSMLIKSVRKPSGRFDGGEARVMFTLDARGRVLNASLSRSSGDDKVDKAVLAAVGRAAPFPPIPEGAGKSTWSFTFPLVIQ